MSEIGNSTEAYRQSGVDLDLSNAASEIASRWAQTTWGNMDGGFGTPIAYGDDFSSARRLSGDEIRNRPNVDLVHEADGSGTKPGLYELVGKFSGLGKDAAAMAADDIPVRGGQPCVMDNILVVNKLTPSVMPHVEQLFRGLAEGANEAGIVLFTGEIAVHGDRLQGPTDFTVDWSAVAEGLVHRDRVITGAKVEVGDELWGFAESEGFRCNGISAVRRAFTEAYGPAWHKVPFGDSTLGEYAIAPSTIYSGLMTALTGGYKIEVEPKANIHGVAHISGGSIPEKVGRMLRTTGLGAYINSPFDLPEIMRHAQEVMEVRNSDGSMRPMSDAEMITTWHGGQGYVVAINERDAEAVLSEAATRGIIAKKIGKVTKRPGIRILSKGVQTPGEVMVF